MSLQGETAEINAQYNQIIDNRTISATPQFKPKALTPAEALADEITTRRRATLDRKIKNYRRRMGSRNGHSI